MDGPTNNGGSILELSRGLEGLSLWPPPRLFSAVADDELQSVLFGKHVLPSTRVVLRHLTEGDEMSGQTTDK